MPNLTIKIENVSRQEAYQLASRIAGMGVNMTEVNFAGVREAVDLAKKPLDVIIKKVPQPAGEPAPQT